MVAVADYDPDMLRECMFSDTMAPVLAELEGGPRDIAYLAEKSGMDPADIREGLSYMVEHGFVKVSGSAYEADKARLAAAMEDDGHFDGVVDGITKMDSYLN